MPAKKRTRGSGKGGVATPSTSGLKDSSDFNDRRRSGRLSSSGRVRSSYFEDDDVDDSSEDDPPPRKSAKGTNGSSSRRKSVNVKDENPDDEPQYRDESQSEFASASDADEVATEESDSDDEEDEELDLKPQKRGRGRPAKSTPQKKSIAASRAAKAKAGKAAKAESADGTADQNLDDDEDDDDDDEAPRVTYIPLPKLRDTGGVEYEDTRLHENTMLFLKDLKANNKRTWLKMHDAEYRRSLKDWESFVERLTEKISEADETIPELPLRDVIFRIYRDVRFSKDQTPYKAHYSAAWSRTGRKGPYACYYVHVEPGSKCFVGGGLWHPEAGALAKLRADIDERPHRIRRILLNPEFRRAFLPDTLETGTRKKGKVSKKGASKVNGVEDEQQEVERMVLQAFADKNQENALKTKPKGFNPEHRDINLLKLRNYTIGARIEDSDLLGEDAQEKIMAIFRPMVGFVTHLNRVVMPDPGEDSSSDEDGEGRNGQAEADGDDVEG